MKRVDRLRLIRLLLFLRQLLDDLWHVALVLVESLQVHLHVLEAYRLQLLESRSPPDQIFVVLGLFVGRGDVDADPKSLTKLLAVVRSQSPEADVASRFRWGHEIQSNINLRASWHGARDWDNVGTSHLIAILAVENKFNGAVDPRDARFVAESPSLRKGSVGWEEHSILNGDVFHKASNQGGLLRCGLCLSLLLFFHLLFVRLPLFKSLFSFLSPFLHPNTLLVALGCKTSFDRSSWNWRRRALRLLLLLFRC